MKRSKSVCHLHCEYNIEEGCVNVVCSINIMYAPFLNKKGWGKSVFISVFFVFFLLSFQLIEEKKGF